MGVRLVAIALVATTLAASLAPRSARGDESKVAEADLVRAKELFRQGVALFEVGQLEHALDLFLQSRAIVASVENSLNAAVCLDRLERWEEALDLYEELITRFGAELTPKDRDVIVQTLTRLRGTMGGVEVVSNVGGASLLVDGRPRGKVPRNTPVPVAPGHRVVRVLKDGYKSFQTTIDVGRGALVHVDAVLEPLAAAGQLRVEDPDSQGAELFVDRVNVGRIPWEGTLGPGRHILWEIDGDRGTAPTEAIVVQGQLAVIRLRARPLGQTFRIDVMPPTAEPSIDGVALGAGGWIGRLPFGPHAVAVSEPGYVTKSLTVEAVAGRETTTHESIALDVDRNHPRWPKPPEAPRTQFTIGGFGGYAFGEELNPNTLDRIRAPNYQTGVDGVLFGLRAGYRLRSGLALELSGGYVSLTQVVSDTTTQTLVNGQAVDVYVQNIVRTRGPFAAIGASVRLPRDTTFGFVGRLALGAVAPNVSRSNTTTGPNGLNEQKLDGSAKPYLAVMDVGLEAQSGRIHAGILLGAMSFATYGLLVPQVQAGYTF